jgi:hypothetical protein
VGKQEVYAGRFESDEGLVHLDRVVGHVNGAEQPRVDLSACPEQGHCFDYMLVTTAAVLEKAMPVVRDPVAIEGDSDSNPVLSEKVTELFIECDTVCVDYKIQLAEPVELFSQDGDDLG